MPISSPNYSAPYPFQSEALVLHPSLYGHLVAWHDSATIRPRPGQPQYLHISLQLLHEVFFGLVADVHLLVHVEKVNVFQSRQFLALQAKECIFSCDTGGTENEAESNQRLAEPGVEKRAQACAGVHTASMCIFNFVFIFL